MKDTTLNEVKKLVRKYPNNMELGKRIRQFISEKDDNLTIEQFNRNRAIEDQVSTIEEMEKRVDEIFNS